MCPASVRAGLGDSCDPPQDETDVNDGWMKIFF